MKKKALLVGINQYQIPGADLRGCVNDVRNIRQVLYDYCGFGGDDIVVLQDREATKANLENAYRSLVEGAESGDVLLAHFSGHGSNVPDKNGDEADYRDEVVCPADLNWRDPFLDDWFRDLFDHVPDGVNLTVIMDCCHSGTITRAIHSPDSTEPRERFLPSPSDLEAVESGRELRGSLRGGWAAAKSDEASDTNDINLPEILLSGCKSSQTSADAYIDGGFHGAMSYSLVNAIKEANGNISYSTLHHRMKEFLADHGFLQVPQLEGRASRFNRKFLSGF